MKIIKRFFQVLISLLLFIMIVFLPINILATKVNQESYHQDIINENYISKLSKEVMLDKEELNELIDEEASELIRYFRRLNLNKLRSRNEKINTKLMISRNLENRLSKEYDQIYKNENYRSFLKLGQNKDRLSYLILASLILLIIIFILSGLKEGFKAISWISFSTSVTFILMILVINYYKFIGSSAAVYLNLLFQKYSSYLIMILQLSLLVLLISLVMNALLILREKKVAKKKGLRTLDNFFDDYDGQEIAKIIAEEEKVKERRVNKKKNKKKENK